VGDLNPNTVLDWIELLLVPLVLVGAAALFTWLATRRQRADEERRTQAEREQEERRTRDDRELRQAMDRHAAAGWEKELDRSCEAAFQAYLDEMAALLQEGLRESAPDDAKRGIAQARTLAVLRQLDGKRRGPLLRFLHRSGLIGQGAIVDLTRAELVGAKLQGAELRGAMLSVANLEEADLDGADLDGADLSWANLRAAGLRGASLEGANLRGAFLFGADLGRADLRGTDLRWANLEGVDLTEADLEGADLHWANLEGADLTAARVSGEQLALVKSLEVATMPDGTRRG
jgi:uncharacterized protein YjbI with pentapeptide repeats